jgi:hypothetical protein
MANQFGVSVRIAFLGLAPGIVFLAGSVSAQPTEILEIRFCPVTQVRTFPLDSRRGVQSLLLQNAAVINHGASSVDVTGVDVELLQGESTIDTRRIAGADLARLAASGPAIQRSGMMRVLSFQFCGSALIADGMELAGPTVAPGQALLLSQQPFAYRGKRDALRVRVHARSDNRDVATVATLPIVSAVSKTSFRFPLRGMWFAAVVRPCIPATAGRCPRNSRMTSRNSAMVTCPIAAPARGFRITTLTARQCSRRPTE